MIASVASIDRTTIALGIPLALACLGLLALADGRRERGMAPSHWLSAAVVLSALSFFAVVIVRFRGMSA